MEVMDLVRRRAERVYVYARDYLIHRDESHVEVGEGFRFATLVLLGPKEFLKRFGQGRLDLDVESIECAYWDVRGEIPGPSGLMNEERVLIRDHNSEVERLLVSQRPTLRVVQAIGIQ